MKLKKEKMSGWRFKQPVSAAAGPLLCSEMAVHVEHRFCPSLFSSNRLSHHRLSSVLLLSETHFHTAWENMRPYVVRSSLRQDVLITGFQHRGQRPCSPSHPGWAQGGSIPDQYSLDNLTSAFSSVCPNLCFVSWLLIKWMSPGSDLQWKDWAAPRTTDSSNCKPGNCPIISSSLTPCDFCTSTGHVFPERHRTRKFLMHFKWRSFFFFFSE